MDTADRIREAVRESGDWAQKGWSIVFGPGDREIASLDEALKARERGLDGAGDALAYWRDVAASGRKCVALGQSLLELYRQRRLNEALDLAQECVLIEKQYGRDYTWGPVMNAIEAEIHR